MPESNDTKAQRSKKKKWMLVRYGRMNQIGLFEHNEAHIPKTDTRVVVKTQKGLQLGKIVGAQCCYRGGRFKSDSKQLNEYYRTSEIDMTCERAGKFIRFAGADDLSEVQHLQKIAKDEIAACKRIAEENNLAMKIVDAEHILGGERIIFYFMSEGRVDFRDLVKTLSHEFQTRIEMRQIGARDEARLLGDVEGCGQQCCCQRFLKFLKPVNMRMAKMQKATLDPAKISGYCGRLKCCLRYEDKQYSELKKKLPKRNTMVKTPSGVGRVIDGQILTQLVIVEIEGTRVAVPVDDIRSPDAPDEPQKDAPPTREDRNGPRRENRNRPRQPRRTNKPDQPNASDSPEKTQGPETTTETDKTGQGEKSGRSGRPNRRRRQNRRGNRGRNQNKPGDNPGNRENRSDRQAGKPNRSEPSKNQGEK
jgi:cell fate regulator YaaT (PSP1 superfamily)